MNKPEVTVVIPTYNRPDMITGAIKSVLDQTYDNFELIVVDDGSADETREKVDKINDDRIYYISHKSNRGNAAARNTGIEHSEGKYIAFLDDDDRWLPSKLEKQINLMRSKKGQYGLVYCWMNYMKPSGEIVRRYTPKRKGYIFPEMLEKQAITGCSTYLVKKEAAERVGGFDENMTRGVDGDFVRRLTRDYKVDYVPEVLVEYYVEHEYERITNLENKRDVRNAIRGETAKLRKFEEELNSYPKKKARILSVVGHLYGLYPNLRRSLSYYLKSFITYPFSKQLYRNIYDTFQTSLKRALKT